MRSTPACASGSSSSGLRRFSAVGDLLAAFPDCSAVPMPRQGEIADDFLDVVPSSRGLESIVDACLGRLASWLLTFDRVMIWKVGLAHDPRHRWCNLDFGYILEQTWMAMDLVFSGTSLDCRALEISLIGATRSIAGCQNILPGGEGVLATAPSGSTCFVYIVVAPAGAGGNLREAWVRRARALRTA